MLETFLDRFVMIVPIGGITGSPTCLSVYRVTALAVRMACSPEPGRSFNPQKRGTRQFFDYRARSYGWIRFCGLGVASARLFLTPR